MPSVFFSGSPRSILLFIMVIISMMFFPSCNGGNGDVPLDEIDLKLRLHRLDIDMYSASREYMENKNADSLKIFQNHFSQDREFLVDWMFGGDDKIATDSVLAIVMQEFVADSFGAVLIDTIHDRFQQQNVDFEILLTNPFKRFHYYFPEKIIPAIVTYIDGYPQTVQGGLDQVFISPRFLGIGIHYFMGPEFYFYPPDMPSYVRRRCTPDFIPVIVMHRFADAMIPSPPLENNPVLIDYVIQGGMKMYFVDKMMGPETPDSMKIMYSRSQMEWADFYEGRVYKDLVTSMQEINPEVIRKFMDDSPFTSQLNRESAPRLGMYIGWKIVQTYMENHPEEKLDRFILRTDYQKIFRDSKYRPPRDKD